MKQGKINIGMVSTFLPTQCGIATYVEDVISAINETSDDLHFTQIKLLHSPLSRKLTELEIENSSQEDYLRAANYINEKVDIVHIQHEFKIFGKPDGANILFFLDAIQKPVVTTLHTITQKLSEKKEIVFEGILEKSNALIVFSDQAKRFLIERYQVKTHKIVIVPHGVPQIDFLWPREVKARGKIKEELVFVSAGHFREAKGYRFVIEALNSLRDDIASWHYLILGADHPEDATAKPYRSELCQLIDQYGLTERVTFVNEYLTEKALIEFIQAADVGLLPYIRMDQSSSGILPLMIACGRPILSTPFDIAEILVKESTGVLSKSKESHDIATAIKLLLRKKYCWQDISINNFELGQTWRWRSIAGQFIKIYENWI